MVEAIKVDTTVDRIRSKSKEDRTFALKLDNHFCPMTNRINVRESVLCPSRGSPV